MNYPEFDRLVSPARSSSEPFRLIGGLALIFFVVILLQGEIYLLVGALLSGTTTETTAVTFSILMSFLAVHIGVFIAMRLMHQRNSLSLIGNLTIFSQQFLQSSLWLIGIIIILMLVPVPEGMELQPNLAFSKWILWLLPALCAVLIQTSAEEVLFRGYMQSQLAARFPNPLVWMVLPSVLFGLIHYDPATNGDANLYIRIWAGFFGLAAADLTARAGTLGPAIAFHFINNIGAILLTAAVGPFDGLALYVYPFSLDEITFVNGLLPDLLWLFTAWLAIRVAIRR